jgi:hypothetical protein
VHLQYNAGDARHDMGAAVGIEHHFPRQGDVQLELAGTCCPYLDAEFAAFVLTESYNLLFVMLLAVLFIRLVRLLASLVLVMVAMPRPGLLRRCRLAAVLGRSTAPGLCRLLSMESVAHPGGDRINRPYIQHGCCPDETPQ